MSSKDLKQEEQAEKNQINHERSDLRKVLAFTATLTPEILNPLNIIVE